MDQWRKDARKEQIITDIDSLVPLLQPFSREKAVGMTVLFVPYHNVVTANLLPF